MSLNKAITKFLAIDWIKTHVPALLMGLTVILVLSAFMLNSDTTFTEETATVLWSFNSPGRYSATDAGVIAELQDGKTVELGMPGAIAPPAIGKQIRVKRIRRLFFGERFVWLRETLP
jgi:hypothetical protein